MPKERLMHIDVCEIYSVKKVLKMVGLSLASQKALILLSHLYINGFDNLHVLVHSNMVFFIEGKKKVN